MSDHRLEKCAPAPWHVPIAVEDVAEAGERFDLDADPDVRAAVARMARLRDLPRLQAQFEVRRHGSGGVRVTGRVSATVGQTCVITLEPLVNEIDEEVDVTFMPPQAMVPAADEGAEAPAHPADTNAAEPLLEGRIDLGALATEFLILGLDPYPRKPGAVFQPPQETRSNAGPFAALAPLKKARDDR